MFIYERKFDDILFFADAPIKNYPYQLSTFKKVNKIKEKNYRYILIDLGVYTYLVKNREHKYPEELVKGLYDLSFKLTEKEYVAVPDYPPINLEFNKHIDYDNIKLTIDNWIKFKNAKVENCIFTIQFDTLTDLGIVKDNIDLYPEPPGKFLGLGGLCRLMGSKKEKNYVYEVLRYIRHEFPNHFIHVWGMSIWHLKSMRINKINSFDNSKWTRPVNVKKLKANWGCKNKEERIRFFKAYLERIYEKRKKDNEKIEKYLI